METGVSVLEQVQTAFGCAGPDVRTYSPLALAYMGDAVYDLIIRTIVVEQGNKAANLLHRRTVRYVNAGAQASVITSLQELLTEEEEAVYRRGRNAKSHTMAKHATVEEYRKATGLEALIGYLYLSGRFDRILELVRAGLERTGLLRTDADAGCPARGKERTHGD